MRVLLALLLLLTTVPAFAQDADDSPEPPLPKAPPEMPLASAAPIVLGPDPRELLVEQCKDEDFVECFKKWRPPPPPAPPPEPEKKEAKAAEPPAPPDPNAPREPAVGGPLVGPPPEPNPAADQATYDALVKAMKEAGLDGKVTLPGPPQDGSATMELAPPKPVAPKPPTGKSDPKQKTPAKP
ncbi:hypothetical protein [Azospirillum sp.]|uniref:hypothetical protein n=1 Tax=Azospirillum sp. TaxID=34012 RepID=UPI003D709ED0